jgi:putative DNA primase/helicase
MPRIRPVRTEELNGDEDNDHSAPQYSDENLALRFADFHAHEMRYVALWAKWMAYDDTRWQRDDTLNAFDRARAICRSVAATCNKDKTRMVLASAKTVAAVERLARSDRRIAATVELWDANDWLINTGGDD